ncbi:hypothetical protein [Chitinophaga solisilvae]|uniref:Uncharacterized protein n=1 Tax=Chitinophaga solisilvae TaxID=1233460 RepID=A0A9Q5GX86_9BACT|nr:hypothetical protein [Chitinophaga solisilvae]NSL91133.1 hypothetical protein [Chitinophaga solisilvae]
MKKIHPKKLQLPRIRIATLGNIPTAQERLTEIWCTRSPCPTKGAITCKCG